VPLTASASRARIAYGQRRKLYRTGLAITDICGLIILIDSYSATQANRDCHKPGIDNNPVSHEVAWRINCQACTRSVASLCSTESLIRK